MTAPWLRPRALECLIDRVARPLLALVLGVEEARGAEQGRRGQVDEDGTCRGTGIWEARERGVRAKLGGRWALKAVA